MSSGGRYAQVVRSYLRWWPMRLLVLAGAVYGGVVFFWAWSGAFPHNEPQLTVFGFLLMITAGAAAVVTLHLKSHLADARSSTWPRYRTPHLIIGAAAMVLLTFGLAAAVIPTLGLSRVGALALVALAVASTAWWIQLQNFTIGLLVNVLWLSLLNRRLMATVGHMLYGERDGLATALLAVGIGTLFALWWRMARMHEGMAEYARRVGPQTAMFRGSACVEASSDNYWLESILRRPIRTRCIAAANLWVRAGHLRATGLGRMPWLFGGFIAASVLTIPLLSGGSYPAAGALESFMTFTMILPPALVFSHWARRWPALGYESLRPASRASFIREVGLAIGLDLLEAWLILAVAGLVPMLFSSSASWPDVVFGGYFELSAALIVVVFALNAWTLRFRNVPLNLTVMALSALMPILPMALHRATSSAGITLPLALGLLVIGALVTLDAYQRWCRTDLD